MIKVNNAFCNLSIAMQIIVLALVHFVNELLFSICG